MTKWDKISANASAPEKEWCQSGHDKGRDWMWSQPSFISLTLERFKNAGFVSGLILFYINYLPWYKLPFMIIFF
jgi:hypothetical protein